MTLVGFLTYAGEYISYIIILAWINDKLVIQFALGTTASFAIALISGLYLIVSGLLALPFGHLSDKFGRRIFSVLGSAIGGFALLGLILLGSLSNLTSFTIGIALVLLALGFGHATYTASTWAYVGDIARETSVGRSYGLLEAAEYAAYSFGPAIGGVVAFKVGRENTFLISAILLLSAALIATFLMRDTTRVRIPAMMNTTTMKTFTPVVGVTHDDPDLAHGSGDSDHDLHQDDDDHHGHSHGANITWSTFFSAFRDPVISATLLTTLLMSLALQAFYIYIPLFAFGLTSTLPILAILAPALASVAAGTSVILMFPFGVVVDSTKRRMPLLVAGLLIGSSSLILVFFNRALPSLVVAAFIFGVALAMARVSQAVLLSERSTFENRAAIMGTNHGVEHAGYGMGAILGGTLIALFGIENTFRNLSGVLLLSAILFLLFALWKKIN